jgi:NAD(P)-dependent dehydrogenase (short-subunit alcohol dehydrogenase family)
MSTSTPKSAFSFPRASTASSHRGAVVVTGASSGIGRATAVRLARAGFEVFAGVRKEEDERSVRALAGASVTPIRLDVTHPDSVAGASREVSDAVGQSGIAGLVNNAGIATVGPIEYEPLDEIRNELEVNVLGAIAMTQAFLPMVRRAGGRIINIGSIGDRFTPPFGGALCASKSALRSVTEALRMELRPWGIHVCLIEPAAIVTRGVDKVEALGENLLRSMPPEAIERYGDMLRGFLERSMARERAGSPPSVVADVVFRALTDRSPKAVYPAGKGSRFLRLLPSVLSDRALDRLRLKLFALPSRFGALAQERTHA